jgi:hypothetical protein
MLGSAADAEDVVQETWLRWDGLADERRAEIRDARAYLVRMVTRQALNRLRTLSRQREDYVGEWLLAVTSTVRTSCDDGYSDTTLLSPADSPNTMTVSRASGSDGLLSSWLCDLTLRFDGTGAHLNDANPACTDTSGDPAYTWTASKFDIVAASGGATAMHTATYKRKDAYVDGTVTNCDQTVTAPMTKQ